MSHFAKVKQLLQTFHRRAKPLISPSTIYSKAAPTDQVSLDLFEGEWTSKLPGLESGGSAALFSGDDRPAWFARACGGLKGKSVLELGPLEGGHTYQLERLGANVTAIESNTLAFQRCLIVKNIYSLRAKFLLGDFVRYLEATDERFDAVFASGVLYHMKSPVALLESLARVTDNIFLWTHYYDSVEIKKNEKVHRSFGSGKMKSESIRGESIISHERRYNSSWLTYFQPGFCGGMDLNTYWLELEGLEKCLALLGFEISASEIAVSAHGPHVTLTARRRLPA